VSVRASEQSHEVDARPRDTLNLAARLGCPIFVAPSVTDTCAISSDADIQSYLHELSRPGNVTGPGESKALADSARRNVERPKRPSRGRAAGIPLRALPQRTVARRQANRWLKRHAAANRAARTSRSGLAHHRTKASARTPTMPAAASARAARPRR